MGKLCLYDKFFHSFDWDDIRKEDSLERFRAILRSGHLLSAEKLGIKSPFKCNSSVIYLGIHPDGIYTTTYSGRKRDEYSGYFLATRGSYFILSSKLCKDYSISPGTLQFECTIPDEIDLYKYLVGIGNAGLAIDENLIQGYLLTKYINGEMPELVIERETKDRNPESIIRDRVNGAINRCFTPCRHFISDLLSTTPESFITVGNYYNISRILREENRNIQLYDNYGNPINPGRQLTKTKKMYEYIAANREIVNKPIFKESLDRLEEYLTR